MEGENIEELQTRHRKEQRDLQSRITQKKKAATKKTRKGVNSECEELERQLKERQDHERAIFNGESIPAIDDVPGLDDEVPAIDQDTQVNSNSKPGDAIATEVEKLSLEPTENGQPRNRAKERIARRAAEQEAAVAEAKQEAANQPDQKEVERTVMLKEIEARGLVEKPIRPDGHCLFSAVADQLSQAGIPLGFKADAPVKEDQRYTIVRKAAARYIEGHPDDFMAWLDEPLPDYVHKIRDTAEWGGHLELLALAKTYNVEICVLQNGAPEYIKPGLEESKEPEKIWLAYYRHGYGLGEHYNSLRRAP